jgi:hypothetical protein
LRIYSENRKGGGKKQACDQKGLYVALWKMNAMKSIGIIMIPAKNRQVAKAFYQQPGFDLVWKARMPMATPLEAVCVDKG